MTRKKPRIRQQVGTDNMSLIKATVRRLCSAFGHTYTHAVSHRVIIAIDLPEVARSCQRHPSRAVLQSGGDVAKENVVLQRKACVVTGAPHVICQVVKQLQAVQRPCIVPNGVSTTDARQEAL
jgi:diaminopimelate epimerase